MGLYMGLVPSLYWLSNEISHHAPPAIIKI